MKLIKTLVFLGLLFGLVNSANAKPGDNTDVPTWEADAEFSKKLELKAFRQLPVQEGGRRKPIDTLAREFVFKLTERHSINKLDPLFMVLSMAYEGPDVWYNRRIFAVRNLHLIELFQKHSKFDDQKGRTGGSTLYVSAADIEKNPDLRRLIRQVSRAFDQSKPLSKDEKATNELFHKLRMARTLPDTIRLIPVSDNVDDQWTTIHGADPELFKSLQELEQGFALALKQRDSKEFNTKIAAFVAQMKEFDFKVYPYYGLLELEYSMHVYKPFQKAQIFYILAALCLIASLFDVKPAKNIGLVLFTIGLIFHVGGLVGRGFLVSRSPVASLYETLLFMTGFAAALAWVLDMFSGRKGYMALGASTVCFLGLFCGDYAPIYAQKQGIQPLVPVLRSYWLNIHVTCMIASYGACLLAAAMSGIYLFKFCVNGKSIEKTQSMVDLDTYIYRTVQVGFCLLTVGIILGGVWANQSWGRYWDWDPKETWAFISWVAYAAYLHARMVGYGHGALAAIINLCAFWCVMFTYLGVSYVLPGLHSYVSNDGADYYAVKLYFAGVPFMIVAFYTSLWMLFGSNAKPITDAAVNATPKPLLDPTTATATSTVAATTTTTMESAPEATDAESATPETPAAPETNAPAEAVAATAAAASQPAQNNSNKKKKKKKRKKKR